MVKISFVAIGSELLKGRIVNTNATYIGNLLRSEGYDLHRAVAVQDTREAILEVLKTESAYSDVILISGGLGPTSDDITKKTIADYFGAEMYEHEPTVNLLKGYFESRGRELTPRNRAQALVPTNSEVMMNLKGTAPGMWFEEKGKYFASMPGVPFEMMYLMEKEVMPRLKNKFPQGVFLNHILRLWNIPESSVADRLSEIEANFPQGLDISYLPRLDSIWLELTIRGEESAREQLRQSLDAVVLQVKNTLSKWCFMEGMESVEAHLLGLLKAEGKQLAIAESLTGGMVSQKIVSVSGASAHYQGGICAYTPAAKMQLLGVKVDTIEKYSVVSEEVVKEMAKGIRNALGADIGIATTGYAEAPSKGENPRCWVGFSDGKETFAQEVFLFNDRNINIERAANAALIFAIQQLGRSLDEK